MQNEERTYFWPYDIFGYLFPGTMFLATCDYFNNQSRLLDAVDQPGKIGHLLIAVAMAYLAGHIIAALSSLVIERWLLRRSLGYPTSRMMSASKTETWPARWLLPGYTRAYSESFRLQLRAGVLAAFHVDPSDEHDLFWLCWERVAAQHKTAYQRASHFLELYGLARNVCMTVLLLACLPFLPGWTSPMPTAAWIVLCVVVAYLMFVNYTKLLRRLNDEVYRAFVSLAVTDHDEGP